MTFPSNNFKLTFITEDVLSGFKDDLAFNVKIDKEWLIPEYEPETKKFIARPEKPLSEGRHHLGIEVVDAAGNKTEKYLNFYIRTHN